MTVSPFARLYSGVAYREEAEDRGDMVEAPGGGDDSGEDAAAKVAADAAAKEAADKAAADKASREAEVKIPKARFDEAVAKERRAREDAERRLAERDAKDAERAKGETAEKLQKEIDDLEVKLDAAELEGKPEDRQALRKQIRAKERELAAAQVAQASAQARALAIEQVRYDGLVERTERDYPFLVPGTDDTPNPDYNEAMARDILEMKAGFEHAGYSSTQALERSLKLLKPALDAAKKPAAEPKKEEPKGEDAKAKAEADAKARAAEAKRREEAVAKGSKAAASQPAAATGAPGAKTDNAGDPDVKKMSQSQFDKLPEDEVKRLRGDFG